MDSRGGVSTTVDGVMIIFLLPFVEQYSTMLISMRMTGKGSMVYKYYTDSYQGHTLRNHGNT